MANDKSIRSLAVVTDPYGKYGKLRECLKLLQPAFDVLGSKTIFIFYFCISKMGHLQCLKWGKSKVVKLYTQFC